MHTRFSTWLLHACTGSVYCSNQKSKAEVIEFVCMKVFNNLWFAIVTVTNSPLHSVIIIILSATSYRNCSVFWILISVNPWNRDALSTRLFSYCSLPFELPVPVLPCLKIERFKRSLYLSVNNSHINWKYIINKPAIVSVPDSVGSLIPQEPCLSHMISIRLCQVGYTKCPKNESLWSNVGPKHALYRF